MVAYGDREDFLPFLRMGHFRRKCPMRKNGKRDAAEALSLPARGIALQFEKLLSNVRVSLLRLRIRRYTGLSQAKYADCRRAICIS